MINYVMPYIIEDFNEQSYLPKYINIPKNEKIEIDKFDFYKNGQNFTEWTKLNALVNYICGMTSDGYYLNILKKVIKEEWNSDLIVSLKSDCDFFIPTCTFEELFNIEDCNDDEIYDYFYYIISDKNVSINNVELSEF